MVHSIPHYYRHCWHRLARRAAYHSMNHHPPLRPLERENSSSNIFSVWSNRIWLRKILHPQIKSRVVIVVSIIKNSHITSASFAAESTRSSGDTFLTYGNSGEMKFRALQRDGRNDISNLDLAFCTWYYFSNNSFQIGKIKEAITAMKQPLFISTYVRISVYYINLHISVLHYVHISS